ncbi:MAG: RdgB/HAM1 family non-canonical purine NTP pyrophosphatase [Tissierellia bacterium]|nr:RdgB/HAM1 family non-canonical purine NTP pyrophosphatase [Tissierellia bacterium]
MKKIVLATNNAHKAKEIENILRDLNVEIVLKSEVGLKDWDVEETGDTLEENALIKARSFKESLGEIDAFVLADDTGLFVEKLNGEPGVYSARYAGAEHDDEANNKLLLKNMKDFSGEERRAEFRTIMALIDSNGREYLATGDCKGKILESPRGANGFGYDPLFVPENYEESFAELSDEIKNKISHRYNASISLYEILKGIL